MIPVVRFAGQNVAVLGLGRSGLAAARALEAGGAHVFVWDDKIRTEAAEGFEARDPVTMDWRGLAALILSPGIAFTHPEPHPAVVLATAAGVPVIGDIELFLAAKSEARMVGITGTNGKSTTTALIGHVLRTAGRAVEVGGNLGIPALELAPLAADGVYVLELSSFQIDLTPSLACDVAVLLNISADHLDRHGSMERYAALKRRIFDHPKPTETAVIGVDDGFGQAISRALQAEARCHTVPVSIIRPLADGISVQGGALFEEGALQPSLRLDDISTLPGRHNWQNAACAFAAARALGLKTAEIERGLRSFPGLAHRLELVAEIEGIRFVNDSKATNADAARTALACYDTIYWIAGGRAKAGGITGIEDLLPRVKASFLIGEAVPVFEKTLQGHVPVHRSGTLDHAVREAYEAAQADGRRGAVVLLSPACASYDQFANFEARGEAFRHAVEVLAEQSRSTTGGRM